MARYVERGGEQTFAAPFRQTGTHLRAWPLEADPVALQGVCDRYLNDPSEGAVSYRPMLSSVLIAAAPIAATRSLTPPDSGYGYTPETDLAFWMLVGRGHVEGGEWKLDRLLWFLPYVWVDVPTTMATGREVYGYPKELAYLEGPASDDDPLVVRAETMVLPAYDPDTQLVRAPILEIRRGDASAGVELASLWDAITHLGVAAIEHGDLDLDVVRAIADDLFELKLPMVFLKQFRDIVDPSAACYQAIIESSARVEGVPIGWPLLDPTTITIWDYASHPIARELGLGTPQDGKLELTAPIGVEVHFDFVVELGTVIWRAA